MTATDLDQQLAELRSAADAYAARHQFIPDLAWPEGVRIAVNFTCDFDAMLLRRLLNEPPMQKVRTGTLRLIAAEEPTGGVVFRVHQVRSNLPGARDLFGERLRLSIGCHP